MKLQSFQQKDKGTIAKYNFTTQEALYFKSLLFQISNINVRGYDLIPVEI